MSGRHGNRGGGAPARARRARARVMPWEQPFDWVTHLAYTQTLETLQKIHARSEFPDLVKKVMYAVSWVLRRGFDHVEPRARKALYNIVFEAGDEEKLLRYLVYENPEVDHEALNEFDPDWDPDADEDADEDTDEDTNESA